MSRRQVEPAAGWSADLCGGAGILNRERTGCYCYSGPSGPVGSCPRTV